MSVPPLPRNIARLAAPKFPFGLKFWLGWNVIFEPELIPEQIAITKPNIESALNKYLQRSVDIVANHLVVPFSSTMTSTANPRVYHFRIRVYIENKFQEKQLFMYPAEPVRRIDGYQILSVPTGQSHVNTVTLAAPPN